MLMKCARLLLVWMTAVGCSPGLEPGYRIQTLRVVAIQAEPPEAVPGEAVQLRPILASPDGPVETDRVLHRWWHCATELPPGLSDPLVCATEGQRNTLAESPVLTDQIPSGLFVASTDADGESQTALMRAILGYWRVVGLTVHQDDEQIVDAVKRIPIFPAAPLGELDPRLAGFDVRQEADGQLYSNQNPVLHGIEVVEGSADGVPVSSLVAGKSYWLRPVYDDETLQAYWAIESDLLDLGISDPTALDGVSQPELLARLRKSRRCEVPVFSWYTTAGVLQQETTVDESVLSGIHAFRGENCPPLRGEMRRPEVQFTAPDTLPTDGSVHIWAVMRDGRGGSDAQHMALSLTAATR